MAVALVVGLGWMISLCLHEFGHAIAAYWGGDTSVKEKGYLTLNPLKYTDPGLSLVLPLVFLLLGGIALPGGAVYINHHRLRSRAWKSAVSAAGPAMSAVSAIALSIPFWTGFAPPFSDSFGFQENGWFWSALAFLIAIDVFAVLLNLLPIPSLDGYGILEPWLPEPLQAQLNRFRRYGILFLFGLLWFVPPASGLLWGISSAVSAALGVSPMRVGMGYALFRQNAPGILIGAIISVLVYRSFLRPSHEKYLAKGDQDLKKGTYETALAHYNQALKQKPNYAQAWSQKGWALTCLGRNEEALDAFDRAIQHQSDLIHAHYGRAWTLMNLGRWQAASDDFAIVTDASPDLYDAWYYRGNVLSNAERDDAALQMYDRAIALDPKRDEAWFRKAAILTKQGHYDAVLSLCDRACQKHPTWHEAVYIKATLLRVLERYTEAIAHYDQYLQQHPDYAEGWFQRGECRRLMEQWNGAIASYAKALELAPTHAEASRQQKRCKTL
ncbi:MAG: tetratricopeptide repeat protein [Elainellaceae cyanobacterium]